MECTKRAISYFDNAATTRITEPVLEEMMPFLTESYGNPSSTYRLGVMAKQAITTARKRVAKAINAESEQIFFTSSATESNNIVRRAFVGVSTSPYEHPSMPNSFIANMDKIQALKDNHNQGIVTSCIMVHNELGTIFPVKHLAARSHSKGNKFHTDATQAFGHVPIDVKDIDCDFLSLSGHKFHAPKGVGVLYIKEPDKFKSDIIGGDQEKKIRPGTENVASIVGMGKAAELYNYSEISDKHYQDLYETLLMELIEQYKLDFKVNMIKGLSHVWNILNLSFKGINGEGLAAILDSQGFCVSTGSACHSASIEVSPILKEIKVSEDYIHGTIRVSFSQENTINEVKALAQAIANYIGIMQVIKEK